MIGFSESLYLAKEMSLSCRFYANEFPDVEETVVVKVYKITEMGAYVTLTEYNNKGTIFIPFMDYMY
jgi:hypothetical protein